MQQMIVYEDRELLVLHKPAGLAVESASVTTPDVVSMLKSYLKTTYVGLVHRLDQPVEGLFVVAKTKDAAADLTRQLGSGALHKSYQVLAHDERDDGISDRKNALPEDGEADYDFVLRDYLYRDPNTRKAVIVDKLGALLKGASKNKRKEEPKSAVLKGKILEKREGNILLCRIEIETGRFHQIRAQMSHAKMPLLGDRKYASESCLMLTNELGISRLALCADRLSFIHPKSGEQMEFSISPFWEQKDI
ncbi:MAG: RluA family pseudouridine synthase [Lachnospiraceae bacterium]|nr:RluA family pseudouridine synthase [Lachnospiraceae bacterium]